MDKENHYRALELQESRDRSESAVRPYRSNSNRMTTRRPYHHVRTTYDMYRSSWERYHVSTGPLHNISPIKEEDGPQTIICFNNRPIHCYIRSVEELFALQYFRISDMFAYVLRDEFERYHITREIINVYRLRLLDTHNFRQACGYKGLFPCPNIMPKGFNDYLIKLGNCPGRPRRYDMCLVMDCQDQAFNAQGESYILNPLDLRKIPPTVVHTMRFIGNIVFGQPFFCTTNLDAFSCYNSKGEDPHEQGQQRQRPAPPTLPRMNGDSNRFEEMLRRSAAEIRSPRRVVLRTLPPPMVNRDYAVYPQEVDRRESPASNIRNSKYTNGDGYKMNGTRREN